MDPEIILIVEVFKKGSSAKSVGKNWHTEHFASIMLFC